VNAAGVNGFKEPSGGGEERPQPERINGLEDLLSDSGEPGLAELRRSLAEIVGQSPVAGQVLDQCRLPARRPRVYRLRFVFEGWVRSVVAKRLELDTAQRDQMVIRRWLPSVGLGDEGPTLLGVAAEPTGQWVWHVYDDLGARALQPGDLDPEHMRAAVGLIARVHTRFAGHALLAECRLLGSDFGTSFYAANVRDAIRCLETLKGTELDLSEDQSALCQRLVSRLCRLQEEQTTRAEVMTEFGGAETFLHGDLWASHLFMLPGIQGVQARLVGWDHAGVGPISYDLSTFLLRFPLRQRMWVLDLYREAIHAEGWTLPSIRELNLLFETAEFARFANCIIWPALALVHDRFGWGFDELANVEQWFENWTPVLPDR
jgi:hypothetical protein